MNALVRIKGGEKIGGVTPFIFLEKLAREPHSNLIFAVFVALYFGKLHKGTPITQEGVIILDTKPSEAHSNWRRNAFRRVNCYRFEASAEASD